MDLRLDRPILCPRCDHPIIDEGQSFEPDDAIACKRCRECYVVAYLVGRAAMALDRDPRDGVALKPIGSPCHQCESAGRAYERGKLDGIELGRTLGTNVGHREGIDATLAELDVFINRHRACR